LFLVSKEAAFRFIPGETSGFFIRWDRVCCFWSRSLVCEWGLLDDSEGTNL